MWNREIKAVFLIHMMSLLYEKKYNKVDVYIFLCVSLCESSSPYFSHSCDCSDEKREGAVLGSLQTHFVSSIGGARQKEHRNQSRR